MWHRNMRSSLRRRTNKKRPGKGVAHKPGRFPHWRHKRGQVTPTSETCRSGVCFCRARPVAGPEHKLAIPSSTANGCRSSEPHRPTPIRFTLEILNVLLR